MSTSDRLKEAEDAYWTYADYRETKSVTRAESFITACRRLKGLHLDSAQERGQGYSVDTQKYDREIADAQAFIRRRGGGQKTKTYATGDWER